jgi:hypothetical protein
MICLLDGYDEKVLSYYHGCLVKHPAKKKAVRGSNPTARKKTAAGSYPRPEAFKI